MKILAIETSCDESSIALIESTESTNAPVHINVLSHVIHSQAELQAKYGGVFPALAKREHAKNLVPLLVQTIEKTKEKNPLIFEQNKESDVSDTDRREIEHMLEREPELCSNIVRHLSSYKTNIDAIAVTQGPGLEPALWVGIKFAQALGILWNVPVVPVNHMEGHMISSLFNTETNILSLPTFPVLGLLISGGHTEIIKMSDPTTYTCIGKTRDDAVGEAYDKVARLLGLPYPGGPHIARLAEEVRTHGAQETEELPRPMMHTDDLDFSFSGLKTAVMYKVKDRDLSEDEKKHIAYQFEEAVADVLSHKFQKALIQNPSTISVVGGGVAANTYLRIKIESAQKEIHSDIDVRFPDRSLTGDNALMIALALVFRLTFSDNTISTQKHADIRADGKLRLS